MRILIAAALLAAAASAFAQGDALKAAIADYRMVDGPQMFACQMDIDLAVSQRATDMEVDRLRSGIPPSRTLSAGQQPCVQQLREGAQAKFQALSGLLASADARAALREHFIALNSALDGLLPNPGDSQRTLELRRAEDKRRLNEAWLRFQMALKP